MMRDSYHEIISRSQAKRLAIQMEGRMKPNKLFVYGILKRGFSLDLTREGAKFLGEATLQPANLYSIGEGVGLRIEDEGKVYGEVFEIPERMWRWLDSIENHPYTYMRQQVQAMLTPDIGQECGVVNETECWVYVHMHPQYFSGLIESGRYEGRGEYARG